MFHVYVFQIRVTNKVCVCVVSVCCAQDGVYVVLVVLVVIIFLFVSCGPTRRSRRRQATFWYPKSTVHV
jgi:hypothetical protein